MERSKIIIYGIGGLSELVSSFLNIESDYKICGYCIENKYRNKIDSFNDKILIDFEKIVAEFPPSEFSLFIAIGNNYTREQIFSESRKKGYTMISHISPKSLHQKDLIYGENVFITESSSIQPFVEIGNNTIITGTKIGHHSKIGNHVLLSCATLGGNVTIGDYSFLGLNTAVQHNTSIAERNIIGMGCNINNSTQPSEVYSSGKATVKRVVSSERIKGSYM